MAFILQDEMPDIADIFIDDLAIKGTKDSYDQAVIPGNSGIQQFIWEHALDVYQIIHRVAHAGGTFSPTKVQLA